LQQSELDRMSDTMKDKKLFEHLVAEKPVTTDAQAPTLDDVRSLITAHFNTAEDLWKHTAPKKVVSRYVNVVINYSPFACLIFVIMAVSAVIILLPSLFSESRC